jgi:hypothetical protein
LDDFVRAHGLIKGDLQHPAALCALWKDPSKVKTTVKDLAPLSLTGNLYAIRGSSVFLRTLWWLPSIRYLAWWGADVTRTRETMLPQGASGLHHNYTINDTHVQLDPTLPQAEDALRQSRHCAQAKSPGLFSAKPETGNILSKEKIRE